LEANHLVYGLGELYLFNIYMHIVKLCKPSILNENFVLVCNFFPQST
jgi:hypothetical protein